MKELMNLKQYEIAELAGFQRTTWNGYENEKSQPSFDDLIKISEFFDISLDDLIFKNLSKDIGLMNKKKQEKIEEANLLEEENAPYVKDETTQAVIRAMQKVIESQADRIASLKKEVASKNIEIEALKEQLKDDLDKEEQS
ncbi:helix-turn-helix transcriptional regulator [Chitinophagaceae bacterium 26-R-25]|nr:helix-turn-helix transcriptional regulator [Chitinophagaceae bacterium 26-R-25]